MAWGPTDRKSRLPADWQARRRKRLRMDGYRCTSLDDKGQRCEATATDVDHHERGDNHSIFNLRSLCSWHHSQKSAREGNEAMRAALAKQKRRLRRVEKHPGLI